MGRFLKHGEGYPDWSLRLFDRRHARWSDDVVHEYVQCDGPVEKLSGDLMHESGEDIALYLNKQNRYTSLQAEMLYKRGKKAGWASWCSARCCALPSFTWYAVVFWMVCPDLSTSALVVSTAISNTPSSTSCTGWKKIMKILVTGAAGFIGRAVCERLLQAGDCTVVGVDNLNSYYPVSLKQARLATLEGRDGFRFVQLDLADWAALNALCGAESFDYVIHLAAQAGVRYSIDNPHVYAQSNLLGMTNVLEACRRHQVKHLVYASSSSVYGQNAKVPFAEDDRVDAPVSFYAATKKANEVMAHSYAHLYALPHRAALFHRVRAMGKPDMAPGCLPRQYYKAGQSRYSTTVRCSAISPSSTISWKACCG
jgi:hypothetical protein